MKDYTDLLVQCCHNHSDEDGRVWGCDEGWVGGIEITLSMCPSVCLTVSLASSFSFTSVSLAYK